MSFLHFLFILFTLGPLSFRPLTPLIYTVPLLFSTSSICSSCTYLSRPHPPFFLSSALQLHNVTSFQCSSIHPPTHPIKMSDNFQPAQANSWLSGSFSVRPSSLPLPFIQSRTVKTQNFLHQGRTLSCHLYSAVQTLQCVLTHNHLSFFFFFFNELLTQTCISQ